MCGMISLKILKSVAQNIIREPKGFREWVMESAGGGMEISKQ